MRLLASLIGGKSFKVLAKRNFAAVNGDGFGLKGSHRRLFAAAAPR
jgi:hypothetical protein